MADDDYHSESDDDFRPAKEDEEKSSDGEHDKDDDAEALKSGAQHKRARMSKGAAPAKQQSAPAAAGGETEAQRKARLDALFQAELGMLSAPPPPRPSIGALTSTPTGTSKASTTSTKTTTTTTARGAAAAVSGFTTTKTTTAATSLTTLSAGAKAAPPLAPSAASAASIPTLPGIKLSPLSSPPSLALSTLGKSTAAPTGARGGAASSVLGCGGGGGGGLAMTSMSSLLDVGAAGRGGMVNVARTYKFAGEDVSVVQSMDAKAAARLAKKEASPSPLQSLLGAIGPKKSMTTLAKSELDWQQYKEKEGIAEELKRGHGFLEKVDFLQRVEEREHEHELSIKGRR